MRMRELEKRTGVGRETIRFYIREGLLPEPERSSRNSASYTDDHVTRIRAIKRLQEERFLPLAVIKALLDAEDGDRWLHADAFPHLDHLLRARLGGDARVPLDRVLEQLNCTREELAEAVTAGLVEAPTAEGLEPRDVGILRALTELRDIGFTRERGFLTKEMGFYAELIDWLVAQEMRLFFDHTAGQVGEAEAADMAERGIAAINDMLSLMRTREILRRMGQRRRIANDNQ